MEQRTITTRLSQKDLRFQPGGSPVSFEVTAINRSDQFATFEIEVLAAGVEKTAGDYWYRLSPEVSAKTPPGDSALFSVSILDTPNPGFVGTMNLFVQIYALELRQKEREILRLALEPPKGTIPLKIALNAPSYTVSASTSIEISVTLTNLAYAPTNLSLCCKGLPLSWLPEGAERRLQIRAKGQVQTQFLCQIPPPPQAPSATYPFTLEAIQADGTPSQADGIVQVVPTGTIACTCPMREGHIPERQGWLPNWQTNTTSFPLEFTNQGNVVQQIAAQVREEPDQPKCQLCFDPPQIALAIGATDHLSLAVKKRRHWFGWTQKCIYEVKSEVVSDPALPLQPDTHRLKLHIHPMLPLWMQVLGTVALLGLLWWLSWLNPNNPFWGHRAAVNSVRFNGVGDKVVSGASDRSILKWRVPGFFNPLLNQHMGKIGRTNDLAVRVVRYRPVNNDRVAVGLENGEIQIWSALTGNKTPLQTFFAQKDDRVLDLAYTQDSRFLFSGHGSGTVVQWKLGVQSLPQRSNAVSVGFPVYGIVLVGAMENTLAIAGGRNRMALWNFQTNTLRDISADGGGQADYIFSLATAEDKPTLFATANNRGLIQLWNLQPCLEGSSRCESLDQWTADPQGIHSVALSADGCYLASGGESGKTMLWPLTPKGDRSAMQSQGIELNRSSRSVNTVDIVRLRNQILVVRGGDDTQVNLHRTTVNSPICP
jgi:hypothetical protein